MTGGITLKSWCRRMREYLTADDICNQLSMNRSVFKGNILLSEGNTDQRLFNKFIDKKNCKIIPAHSKDNVRAVINKMTNRGDGKIIGVVDRDLDELKGKMFSPPLFYTDYRDMEMMLINSPALDEVLIEYGDQDRLDRFVKQFGEIRDVVISAAYPLGLLMYISYIRGYNLNFRNLNFRDFIDRRSLKTDAVKMVQAVINNTSGCELSRKNVLRDLSSMEHKYPDQKGLARGHDAVDILLIGLRDTFGTYNSSALNVGVLGGALRLAYTPKDFSKTGLYKDTNKWAESRNTKIWNINRCPYPRS